MKSVEEISFQLVCYFEGIKLLAYQDSGGIWTIGIGSTKGLDGLPVKEGATITMDQALILYKRDSANNIQRVEKKAPFADNYQKASLVSFDYNTGAVERINSSRDMLPFVHVKGVVSKGLITRRSFEELLARGFNEEKSPSTIVVAPV